MAPGDDTDSGMESQDASLRESQDSTGSAKEEQDVEPAASVSELPDTDTGGDIEEFATEMKPAIEDAYSDEPDETIAERLWGLTEMFPEALRNVSYTAAMTTKSSIQSFYGFSRSAFWVVFSSSIILFAPVIFEVERVQMEEAQRSQQKQMLLGPTTAVSGGSGMPLMPPMHR